ncbi:nucleoside kinase [Clostridium sp.]|uniref:nucleoside kinase n=1 Tax=Clostridium sp. TaxID=1506 RepID=UPI002A90AE79|nr:nucleoside kinase [Clostridium sp.]MDY6013078.1 nucleoside kinase [Clostridium sp.]
MNGFDIILENGKKENILRGTKFKDLMDKYYKEDIKNIALCRLNNKYYELTQEVKESGILEIIYFNTEEGMNIYTRTLQFIFITAALDVFKDSKITIEHSIGKGLFGEIHKEKVLNDDDIKKIKKKMKEIINKDEPIKKIRVSKSKAIDIFENYGMEDKVKLLEHVDFDTVKLYELEGRYDYFYGKMAYSTGVIRAFDLMLYETGFILRSPMIEDLDNIPPYNEQKRLSNIFYETERWLNIIGVGEVGSLNDRVVNNELKDLILVSEALHEKKIAYIADRISEKNEVKMVLIAGPSSSGKTTFANRLSIQLRVNGYVPVPLSLDDYFIDRELNPKDENGEYDFESIYSLDLKTLNEHLKRLLNGEEVEVPSYNFMQGKREWLGHKVKLPQNGILILEGIHALNPMLTNSIQDEYKHKIYISALTQLNLDNHNRIATTDVRKVRRIVRDFLSRGYGGEETLRMWPSIKRGERRNIFVYQEEADDMFNSTLVYELCVLKPYALNELKKITKESPVFNEAQRLISLLTFFKEISMDKVPENSLLREFIGGSCFYKY